MNHCLIDIYLIHLQTINNYHLQFVYIIVSVKAFLATLFFLYI